CIECTGKNALDAHFIQGRLKINIAFAFNVDEPGFEAITLQLALDMCCLPGGQFTTACAYPDHLRCHTAGVPINSLNAAMQWQPTVFSCFTLTAREAMMPWTFFPGKMIGDSDWSAIPASS